MSLLASLAAWVAPISPEHPAGKDIRQDQALQTLYYKVKDARNLARTIERKNQTGDSDADAQAQWELVLKTAQELLQKHSKDLEVAAWVTEAYIRRRGFEGLTFGFSLLAQLVERYWDQGLYPLPDEEGIEIRIAPIIGLNGLDYDGSLLFPIRNALITAGNTLGPYSLWQYKQAIELEKMSDERLKLKKIQEGAVSLEQIILAAKESGVFFYQELSASLKETTQAFEALNQQLKTVCGVLAPGYSQITQVLEDFQDHIQFIMKDAHLLLASPSKTVVLEVTNTSKKTTPSEIMMNTSLRSREEAFAALVSIAQYFKTHEPHSPLSYSIERLIYWGKLPLPELMKALMDDAACAQFEKLTGVKCVSTLAPLAK